jgi:predicted AAA+ superfamily ATPase
MDYSGRRFSLGFWRTKSGSEVDFVVYGRDGFWAIEVKHGASLRGKDLRSLRAFLTDYPQAQARLLYRGKEKLMMDNVLCLPVDEFLLELLPGHDLP